MRAQLRRLLEAAALPTVTLQVLPFRASVHAVLVGASGSYVVTNDGTNVLHGQGKGEVAEGSARARAIRRYAEAGGVACHLRTPQRIKGFFDGLELVDPGVVSVSRWRPDAPGRLPAEVDAFCGVARRP